MRLRYIVYTRKTVSPETWLFWNRISPSSRCLGALFHIGGQGHRDAQNVGCATCQGGSYLRNMWMSPYGNERRGGSSSEATVEGATYDVS